MSDLFKDEEYIDITEDKTPRKRKPKLKPVESPFHTPRRPPPFQSTPKKEPYESIFEWFDKSLEAELKKHQVAQMTPEEDERLKKLEESSYFTANETFLEQFRDSTDAETSDMDSKFVTANNFHDLSNSMNFPSAQRLEPGGSGYQQHASASVVDVASGVRGSFDSELLDAADKFAKAQAIVSFEGAVRAAEAAAANAPPELAEEAAVAGARGYQARLTGVVNEKVPGIKPLEVIGYVGVTKPKGAKKS